MCGRSRAYLNQALFASREFNVPEDTCMSYKEEDTCMSYEEEDTCMS
jgi:hypothetical protein